MRPGETRRLIKIFLLRTILCRKKQDKRKEADSRRKTKEIVVTDDGRCACCLKPFLIGRGISCNDCGVRSCRKVCSRWDCEDNAWHCLFCQQQRSWARKKEKWFETFGGTFKEEELHRYFDTAKSRVCLNAGLENAATGSSLDLAAGGQEDSNTMETVRVFIEKIIEDLIGNVDDASIDRLYDHPEYDRLLATYSVQLADALARLAVSVHLSIANKPSTDSPTMAHSALRELVERAVEEAKKLPGLAGSSVDNPRTNEECNISEHSYEDLLATAILNKVIEKFQREQVDGNSNVLHEKPSAKAESEIELGLDEGVEEGSSSLEPLSQDECSSDCSGPRSRHSRNRQEPLSLTIEERIEEVTTTYTSDEDPPECVKNGLRITNVRRVPFPELGMDIIDPSQESSDESQDEEYVSTVHVNLVSPFQSWEENWLFQKKRVPIQSDPVAMLVPSSSADFKALIGDKDAEDTSDLSECSSAQSDEEIEKELIEAINNVVPRPPRISESEMVESSLNENEVALRNIEDFHSTEKSCEFTETLFTLDDEDGITRELCNGDVKCTEKMNSEKDAIEEIRGETKLVKNSLNDGLEKEETNCKIEMNDEMFETGSAECEVENKQMVDSKSEIQRTDIRLLQSQKDTLPDVPKTPIPSTLENNFEIVTNDVTVLDFNEKEIFNSLESTRYYKIMDQDIDGEEDKTLYSLDVYSKEGIHFEDGAQQESEYTEHYDTATQRHLDSLTKDDIYVSQNDIINDEVMEINNTESNLLFKDETSKCREAVAFAKADSVSYLSLEKIANKDVHMATPPRPGTIAEREHRKWENAPPIENNPYSEQSIQKRLLERQYSRRSADIPGIHPELPKSNGTDLVLVPNEPDIKRFGRDYYINNAKSPSGDKKRKPITASATSRPSSALSQRSASTGTEQEQQTEEILDKDVTYDSIKSRMEKWRRNNSNSSTEGSAKDEYLEKKKKNDASLIKRQKSWNDQKVEDLLENERKNSKNEINARLNNQDNNCGIFEAKKSYIQSDNQKTIRRIDLKAYGFANEFDSNKGKIVKPTRPQKVVNKLDLKSFGYDGGLRRTQSHNQIDGIDIKPRIVRVEKKSNLNHFGDHRNFDDRDTYEGQCSDDRSLTQSTGTLNELCEQMDHNLFSTMTSAKSVPNIAKSEYYENSNEDSKDVESEEENASNDPKDKKLKVDVENDSGSSNVSSEIDAEEKDRSTEKLLYENQEEEEEEEEEEDFSEEKMNLKNIIENKLPMPSVRRLAEAFNKPSVISSISVPRTTKSNTALNERSPTPEVQIIETPRQMHSLTARSLSKQFRDGLRQIPNKVTSPPASHVTMEQPNGRENQSEIVQTKKDNSLKDINVIAPGKLKSNIKFWEQMQRRS
ncbi:myb-like protein X isoform X2 [Vespa crabro]|uniref:myb-like protein X isoform X2 n=1 Tax=Vespa crabro TaxID=7445 RepID=UPI001F02DA57|nr:myb-like protein X isoform X2 [Vespa crabro]